MTKAERAKNKIQWESRVSEFKASGQSAAQWCATQGLKVHRLHYWIDKFKSENKSAKQQTKWFSVEVGDFKVDQSQEALPVRVGKAIIEVRPGFSPDLLSDVVQILSRL